MPTLSRGATAASALLLCACSAAIDAGAPTYHADIAPLLERSCMPCHSEQSPHSLASYSELVDHAERALALMRAGSMPKGNVDRSGACGDFAGHVPVSVAEIELYADFVGHGMPEGEPRVTETFSQSPPFTPGATLELDEAYLPATDEGGGSGDHRCFALSSPALEGAQTELRAFRVMPTLPEVVHHVMLFALDAEVDARQARELDVAAPGAGWPCFGTPGIAAARLVGVWTPGSDVVRFPDGYATRLGRAGLLAQIHYDGPLASAPDQTRIELELGGGDGLRELRFMPFAAVDLVLPPGREAVRSAHRGFLGLGAGTEILGVYPHMHALGRQLSLSARLAAHDATETCLVNVPRWDYTFQELALYRTPLRVTTGDPQLSIECEHSTLGVERTVTWGERIEDEMCMVFLLLSPTLR